MCSNTFFQVAALVRAGVTLMLNSSQGRTLESLETTFVLMSGIYFCITYLVHQMGRSFIKLEQVRNRNVHFDQFGLKVHSSQN